ncbi:hypothetical protein OH76DRAFT_1409693 [Lentinus brumalis]|uniref:Uncharacterized protein n=1 Tax=Lentinus brumalis TaxID=2498619 RepID=A0A371CUC1_9APHY|nr:hypothetical protein OH76DRAFT_1409693 [Polyporus brumalis]
MNSLQHWELDHLRLELSCLYPSHTLATDLGVDFDTIARNCRGRSQAPWAEFDDSHWRLTAARAPRRGGMNTEHLSDQAQGHLLTTARDWNMVIERALLILHGATPTTTINPSVSKNAVGARDALYEAELSARDDHFAPMVILRLAYRYGETYAAHALAQGRSAAALIYLEYYGSLCDLMPVLPAGVSNDELFEKHTTLIFQTLAQAATYACMCARTHFVTPAVLSVAMAVRYWTSLLRVSTTPHSGAHAALSVISPLRAEKLDIWNDKTRPYPVRPPVHAV